MNAAILTRLRSVDPCPHDVAYADTVAQSNIDAIVRTDLTVRPVAPARPRRRPRAVFAVAAVVTLLAVAGSVVGVEISRDRSSQAVGQTRWETFTGGGFSFEHPAGWRSYPYQLITDVGIQLTYLSSAPVADPCPTASETERYSGVCRVAVPSLAGGGVFVDWTLDSLRGTPSTVDDTGGTAPPPGAVAVDDPRCTAAGGVVAVTWSAVPAGTRSVLAMTACVGPGDVEGELAAVDRMVASVRVAR